MGVSEGLSEVRAMLAKRDAARKAAEEAKESGKINWLTIADGETVRVRYLQELDRGATHYNEEAGIGLFADEHAVPENFKKKAVCSMDSEEQCRGCEKYRSTPYVKGAPSWKAKNTMYINVLVERTASKKSESRKPDDEKRKIGEVYKDVYVMSMSNGPKAVVPKMVLKYAVDKNTITDRWWSIERSGADSTTTYSPMVDDPSDDVDVKDYLDRITNLHKCIREPSYEEQDAFYFGVTETTSTPEPVQSGSTNQDQDW